MSVVVAQSRRRVGRPALCSPKAARRILELRAQNYSLRRIAKMLNDEGVSTPMGLAKWSKSHVHRVLGTLYMQELSVDQVAGLPH